MDNKNASPMRMHVYGRLPGNRREKDARSIHIKKIKKTQIPAPRSSCYISCTQYLSMGPYAF